MPNQLGDFFKNFWPSEKLICTKKGSDAGTEGGGGTNACIETNNISEESPKTQL